MSRGEKGIAVCPRCRRTVSTSGGRYCSHKGNLHDPDARICELSLAHEPFRADQQDSLHYVGRAHLVANLAADLQDADPAVVWDYITALPVDELHRLMVIALAGIPVDQAVNDIFAWVCDLPIAKTPAVQENNAA